ncbi:hypothetical protein C1646_722790 [Rhizophagus diaphanus]|nr:hypothetical protein C1646_722790 [Rhizophagus diaphanus] [Rhizophagus sp. MUCL 43196]
MKIVIHDDVKYAEGGFVIIYKAIWLDASSQYDDLLSIRGKNKTVAIKRFLNSQNISIYFLSELKPFYQCYNKFDHIIRYYGTVLQEILKRRNIRW